MVRRVIAGTRYIILIAVLGSFLAAVLVLLYGAGVVVAMGYDFLHTLSFTPDGAKHLAVEAIEETDLFLLGTVLYIVAIGLYELFIDEHLPTPRWLVIMNLDDLKERLVGVIIVLLAVTFLANVVEWNGSTTILDLGVGIGVVLFALGYFLKRSREAHAIEETEQVSEDG